MTETYTVTKAIEITGYSRNLINKQAFMGKITVINGRVSRESIKEMLIEKKTYISLLEYSLSHSSQTYNGRKLEDRKKLLEYFERNNYFDMKVIPYNEMLMGEKQDTIFFVREEIIQHESDIQPFFASVNLPEEKKIRKLLLASTGHDTTVKCLHRFISSLPMRPSVTEFVCAALLLPDIPYIQDSDIKNVLAMDMSDAARKYLISFLHDVKKAENAEYSKVEIKKKKSEGEPAYPNDVYLTIIHCIFNAKHIHEHQMIEKALNNHWFCEMWLYLALHVTCGWRASDICEGWQYIHLSQRESGFLGINQHTLHEDILEDRIADDTYKSVCGYALSCMSLSSRIPSKTASKNPSYLMSVITPELQIFFGLLILIAESVMIKTGDGYMRAGRKDIYQNRIKLKLFFGSELTDALEQKNIHSRRLCKDYLQGIQSAAMQNGCGSLMASAVASYARNHNCQNTITYYLRDHNLTGETAEMLVYYMLERGVFAFEAYQTLLTAYPDIMHKLPIRMQNKLMSVLECDPLRIEIKHTETLVRQNIQKQFVAGNCEYVTDVFQQMMAVTQGFGKAKDEGIYCTFRLSNKACPYPGYQSCLANACPHLIFTKFGLIPLVQVLKEYLDKATTDKKAKAVLGEIIQPRFRDILNWVMRTGNMDDKERLGIQKIMEATLNGEYSAEN